MLLWCWCFCHGVVVGLLLVWRCHNRQPFNHSFNSFFYHTINYHTNHHTNNLNHTTPSSFQDHLQMFKIKNDNNHTNLTNHIDHATHLGTLKRYVEMALRSSYFTRSEVNGAGYTTMAPPLLSRPPVCVYVCICVCEYNSSRGMNQQSRY